MKHASALVVVTLSLFGCGRSPLDDPDYSPDESESDPADDSVADGADIADGDETGTTADALRATIPAPMLVDFDTTPNGGPSVADGTIVDATYSPLGVTLTCVSCSAGHAYARAYVAGNNGVSLFQTPYFPLFDARWGGIRADFANATRWVSIDARPTLAAEGLGTPTSRAWLEAYDANGTMVGQVYYPIAYGAAGWGTFQTLRIDRAAGDIKWVRFSSQYSSSSPPVYVTFDNLRFEGRVTLVKLVPIDRPTPRFPVFP